MIFYQTTRDQVQDPLQKEIYGFFFVFSFQNPSVEEDRVEEIRYLGGV